MSSRPAPGWRVHVQAVEVDRWSIREQTLEVRALDPIGARIAATREAGLAAGLPPWKPALRRLYVRTEVLGRIDDDGDRRRAAA
jgi:hypothetical protein